MPDPTTPNIGLILPTHNEYPDSWDTVVANPNYTTIDNAIGGVATIALTTGTVTLTAAQAAHFGFSFTGSLTGNCIVTFPAGVGGRKVVADAGVTFNGFTITVNAGGPAGVLFSAPWTNPVGVLVLPGSPGQVLQDGAPLGDNRIINGDMRIDQRNNGASGTAAGYTVDRWAYGATVASKGTWVRGSANPTLFALGYGYDLQFTSSSAYTPLAGDTFSFFQPIEADMISDFAWGTSSAQPVTLSFWVFSTLSGTFGGSIVNYVGTRSYPFSYSIPTINTWTKVVVTIPGDTAGTWGMNGNAGSLYVFFDLGSGSTLRGTAGAWVAGNIRGVTGSVSVVATNGAAIDFTGVKLEIGSVATPFNRQSMAKSLADCQRYYEASFVPLASAGLDLGRTAGALHNSAGTVRALTTYLVAKRANATVVTYSASGGLGVAGTVSYFDTTWHNGPPAWAVTPQSGLNGFWWGYALAGVIETQFAWTASAEL